MTRTARFPPHLRDTLGVEIDGLVIDIATGLVDDCDVRNRGCQLEKLSLLVRLAAGLRALSASDASHARRVLKTAVEFGPRVGNKRRANSY